jgi:hypothetical protein
MANIDSLYYTQGAKVRATSEQPQWFSFTITLPNGKALVDEDELRFAIFGANQKILAYALGCDAAIGIVPQDTADLVIGSTVIDAEVETDCLIVADRAYTANIEIAHVTADGDILKLDISTALDSQTSSGVRKITLSVLVAQQNNSDAAATSLIDYSSQYTL